jgi:hypothetical protein
MIKKLVIFGLILFVISEILSGLGSKSSGSGSPSGPGGSASGPAGISVGKATPSGGIIRGALPASWIPLPTPDPNAPTKTGLAVYAFDAPAYADDSAIQGVGTTTHLGRWQWRPLRAGESSLFDDGAGIAATRRPKAYVLRGWLPVPFGGEATIGLRLTHPEIEADAKCSLHVLAGGKSYASDFFSWKKKTPEGSVETTATLTDIPPGAAIDLELAYSCATAGDAAALRTYVIDPIMRTPERPAWKLLRPSDFVFPASAL